MTDFDHCRRCNITTYRERRNFIEKLMLVRSVYICNRCERRLKKFYWWPPHWF